MKGGGPYPGGGILMVTGKVGGTRPTALGTAWATGSWMREIQVRDISTHTKHVNSIMVKLDGTGVSDHDPVASIKDFGKKNPLLSGRLTDQDSQTCGKQRCTVTTVIPPKTRVTNCYTILLLSQTIFWGKWAKNSLDRTFSVPV